MPNVPSVGVISGAGEWKSAINMLDSKYKSGQIQSKIYAKLTIWSSYIWCWKWKSKKDNLDGEQTSANM